MITIQLVGGPLDGETIDEPVTANRISYPVARKWSTADDIMKAPMGRFDGKFAIYERRGGEDKFYFVGMRD